MHAETLAQPSECPCDIKRIAAVPARLESSRLPNKLLADIGGKLMIQRVLERCREARNLDAVVLCTDSVQIPCFTTAFENPLDHQLAADIRQQFIWQSRGFEPRGNRRNAFDIAGIFRRISQCFSNHGRAGRDAIAGSYQ